ncbi:ABC-type Fe3+/spermidine/putrescine transport system ATPase subunit [Rhizobium aethiopicum]|uniref:ABC-type Fe3+/spermidine/putrescine transport system ATPase subunit n=1 Tax=Rhizobium aethiopicum TaxID=1138170 RepID=A0A7W6VS98_9HYPH|nr:ABC-type Fe3+/spermidine/putrescine transport system ATPase subunit [Rhizobium aethiopicum]MBB4583945.1 ABC-type Fe3+/spermidine/putrescine transport system ATPase subunit [Rhizobium aethiopicum]
MGHRLPAELSGGQQQRVAVARALVLEPQVLLLDEPLSNLDARLRRKVRTDIRQLQQRLGFTAVYVTHDQDEALAVSDRIIVMKDGEIDQTGAPRDLYGAPASAFIADFMGEANVIPCEVLGIDGATPPSRKRRSWKYRSHGSGTATAPLLARRCASWPSCSMVSAVWNSDPCTGQRLICSHIQEARMYAS